MLFEFQDASNHTRAYYENEVNEFAHDFAANYIEHHNSLECANVAYMYALNKNRCTISSAGDIALDIVDEFSDCMPTDGPMVRVIATNYQDKNPALSAFLKAAAEMVSEQLSSDFGICNYEVNF